MIAAAFALLLAVIIGVASLFGAGTQAAAGAIPFWAFGVVLALFLVFFAGGIYIGAALAALALIGGFTMADRPFWNFMGEILWAPSTNFVLVAVPLFLLMGEIMLRAGLSRRLYDALNVWFGRLPGGLLHTNILSCSVFSAIAGSSVATAATMGSVALPHFEKTRYPPTLVLGSLAAGGALGNLIPPGITFIIYGMLTETSVGALYLAAVGPSLLVVVLFMALIVWLTRRQRFVEEGAPKPDWRARARSLGDLVPTAILIFLVLGSIYTGLATPTESAAMGVAGAIVLGVIDRRLTLRTLHEALRSTARTTSMIALILFGAYFLNYILSSLGIPQMLATFLTGLPISGWMLMMLIIGFYLALGTVMEGMSMIITTIPLLFPVVKALGYDPIWFGVIVTMLVEIAMISPPDGTVLYVLQGMRRQPAPISDMFQGVLPFLGAYILAVVLLVAMPAIALWLPSIVRT
jgi:tripartite ATP-independent transporter DctM subunit